MADILPPAPQGVPPGHSFWNQWYEKLRKIINDLGTSISWANINFSGSRIQDIVQRAHNNLQNFQGGQPGEYYHLTAAQHAVITTSGILNLYSKSGDPTTTDITSGTARLYKDTSANTIKLWVNDSGTLKSVELT